MDFVDSEEGFSRDADDGISIFHVIFHKSSFLALLVEERLL